MIGVNDRLKIFYIWPDDGFNLTKHAAYKSSLYFLENMFFNQSPSYLIYVIHIGMSQRR
jgi:hypothetical protein